MSYLKLTVVLNTICLTFSRWFRHITEASNAYKSRDNSRRSAGQNGVDSSSGQEKGHPEVKNKDKGDKGQTMQKDETQQSNKDETTGGTKEEEEEDDDLGKKTGRKGRSGLDFIIGDGEFIRGWC